MLSALLVPFESAVPSPRPGAAPPRPKVCLVLSGGGARGAAHVGVLKVLEELRVPIDCITGTSMGSIVGAAYASGTPIDEMEKIISSITTRELFTELPPREDRAVRLKEDDRTVLSPIELGLRDGQVLLPQGLVSGVQLETVLRKLSKVRGTHRFDDLPIPFRAVATDLVTGKAVVLSDGELASAMRASMSVPGAIAPARLDGRLLVDGGLTDNLPVGVARSMGADIVIAVNLGTPLLNADQLNSVLGVTNQMVNILTEQNVQASLASLKPTDVLILPQLGAFSAADFDHLPLTVPIGEAAARAVTDRLAQLSVPPAEYEAWRAHRLAGTQDAIEAVDEIRFRRAAARQRRHRGQGAANQAGRADPAGRARPRHAAHLRHRRLRARQLQHPGRAGTAHPRHRRGREVVGSRLPAPRPRPVDRLPGRRQLQAARELPQDLAQFARRRVAHRFPGRHDESPLDRVLPTARAEPDLLRHAERGGAAAQRGRLLGHAATRHLRRPDGQASAWPSARSSRSTAWCSWGSCATPCGRRSTPVRPRWRQPLESQSYTSVVVQGGVDQLDNLNFSRSGYASSFQVLGADAGASNGSGFGRAFADGTVAVSLGEHTFNFGFTAGSRLGANPLPAPLYFQWGGLLRQSGYPTGALLGEDIAFARLMYYKRLFRWSLLDGVYGGASLEIGRVGRPLVPGNDSGTLRSGALLLGVDTPLGPLYLGYGRTTQGIGSFYLNLGRP